MVASAAKDSMRVQVAGAVRKPGVVVLKLDGRVQDAIEAAGGATRDADLNRLNLADPMVDGAKLRVPAVEDGDEGPYVTLPTVSGTTVAPLAGGTKSSSSSSRTSAPTKSSSGVASLAPASISLNTANAEELDRLPGVGPATAQKILDFRQQIGRFTKLEQLMDVKGIGPKKFEKMRPFLKL